MTTVLLILGVIGAGMILAGCLRDDEALQPAREEQNDMQAVIYTRFSPRRNADKSKSCETQEALCRAYALKHDWPVRAVFADKDKSGSDSNRPGLMNAIMSLCKGDVLVVYKRDRLARDVLIAELTRRQVTSAGATIEAVSGDVAGNDKDPTVMFVRQIMDAVAELERKQIAARTRDSMRQLQSQGRRVGRFAPFGTMIDPDNPTNLIPVEAEKAAIRRARELRAQGISVAAIIRVLDDEMPTAARTGKWSTQNLWRILKREDRKV